MSGAGKASALLCAFVLLPFAAARTMIELTTVDGGPVSMIPETVQYNWSDTSPSGILRGSPDLPASDPRLQPALQGYPEQVSVTYYGPTSVRFGWVTGEGAAVYSIGDCICMEQARGSGLRSPAEESPRSTGATPAECPPPADGWGGHGRRSPRVRV